MRDVTGSVLVNWPGWVKDFVDWDVDYTSDEQRMQLAIELARQNVLRQTGGPFGAAIFNVTTHQLMSVGVNSVVRLNNSALHAEMLAIMMAQQRIGSYTLSGSESVAYQIYSSCDPCAMCLGAVLWSGVGGLVTGANRDDATALSFDEGPVFPESYAYLEARGIAITRGVLRKEAAAVLELYRRQGGPIYNA